MAVTAVQFQRRLLAMFLVVALAIVGLAMGTWKVSSDASQAASWVGQTYEVLDALSRIKFETLRVEFTTQSFRITGDPSRLAERDQAVTLRAQALARVVSLASGNPAQVARLNELHQVIAERLAISRQVETLRRTQGVEAATAYANAAPLASTRQRTTRLLDELESTERALLAQRLAQRRATEYRMVAGGGAFAAIVLALLGGGYLLIRHQNAVQEHHVRLRTQQLAQSEARLQAYQRELEELVSRRTVELAQAHRELKAIFDNAPVGIVLTRQRQVVSCNRRMEELLGWGPGELPGNSARWWFESDEKFLAYGTALYPVLALGQVVQEEMQFRRKDGTMGWFRYAAQSLEPGDPAGMVLAIVEDATRERQAMELLDRQRQQAEAHNTAKGYFLANMSHEIRTPLHAITGMAQLMRRKGLVDDQLARLNTIETAADHLLSVVNDVLDLSKIEAGKFVLDDQPIQVGSVIANVASMLHDRAQAKNIELRTLVAPLPAHLLGDATRVQQCLLNYASNAIKFTAAGRVTMDAQLEAEDDEGVRVRFTVTDTGVGVSPQAMQRLFTSFEQADNSTTREYGGTGLGLAITRKLAHLMGGEAGASSVADQGSQFWFTVRLRKGGEQHVPLPPVESTGLEQRLRDRHAGARVLLVDDDPINRELTGLRLTEAGLSVDSAPDGVQAVDKARERHYDLILMDMQMPHMDGLEATRHIRALPGFPGTPVVAMTANAFAEDRARCMAAGMCDFIPKPCKPEDFYGTVLAWLDRAAAHGSA